MPNSDASNNSATPKPKTRTRSRARTTTKSTAAKSTTVKSTTKATSSRSRSAKSSSPNGNVSPLRVIPLGGLHEIGKNTCVFEYEDELILVDAGLAFPDDNMHGVNIVLPDIGYLKANQDRIRGMIVTHGHEDHIGGIAYHLKNFDIPVIYGPRLAMALLGGKMDEAGVSDRTEVHTVAPRDVVKLGKHFSIEFIRNTHSMADSFSLAITTPVGTVIFTGDFKFDHTPVDGEYFDMQKLAEYGEKGVLCLFSDSTNAEVPGFCPSERSVFPNLDRAFGEAQGRLFVTTFASSVHRVNMILELAEKHNRYVAILGRSMLNVISHARNLGYIRCPDSLFKPIHETRSIPDDRLLILSTGSQGEPMAAMSRIANGTHRQMSIKKGDTVVFSANPIPGNTISVVETIDKLMQQGANVIYGKGRGIHVSGHGFQEDHKLMLGLTRPKFFVPVHGEHRMLVQHKKTGMSLGVPEENILIVDNGDAIELTPDSISLGQSVQSGIELVDSSRTGIVNDRVLKERQQLANDGVVSASVTVDMTGSVVGQPELQIRGVVGSISRTHLDRILTNTISNALAEQWSKHVSGSNGSTEVDWAGLQATLERNIQRVLRRELQCEPLVLATVHAVDGTSAVTIASPAKEVATGTAKNATKSATKSATQKVAVKTAAASTERSSDEPAKKKPRSGRRRTRSAARAS